MNQDPEVVEQFWTWLAGTGVQCVVVEPIARAFSLVVRDDPWGVVLRIDESVGESCVRRYVMMICLNIKIIALSRGANSSQPTEHMFGPASADVYGKLPLEDASIVDVWLRNQLGFSDDPSGAIQDSIPVLSDACVDIDEDDDEVEIELTADLSVSSPASAPRPDSTVDERIPRLELEPFEQSEKMTLIKSKSVAKSACLQESISQCDAAIRM